MGETVTFRGARVAFSATESSPRDLTIQDGHIHFESADAAIDLEGFLVLPGLINAHDHLEFNLFPRLGRGPYQNASAWARDVYHPESAPVRDHRRVAKEVRLFWGGIKNLVSGVTTVCHHNP